MQGYYRRQNVESEAILVTDLEAFDWAETPLGPKSAWSPALRTTYEIIMSSGFAMCAMWGDDRTFLYNKAYAPFLGARHPEALGKPIDKVWPEIWNDISPLIDRTLAGETLKLENLPLVMTRHGYPEDTFWTFSYSPLRDEGRIIGFLNVTTETTELVTTQARDRTNAERVQLALTAGAIIGTWVWDVPNDRFTADEGFARSFGFDPELGRSGISLDQATANVHPDDKLGLASAIADTIERGSAYTHRYRVKREDGPYYWVEASGRVDRDADGTPVNFPGVVMNIDARRAIEDERDRVSAELRALNHDLEKRVLERTSQLTQAEDALRHAQKMEAIGQLTGGVAHDFNNLLTVIRGSVDLLRRADIAEERRAKYVDAIADTADRATKLTAQLLAFARRQSLKPDVFDVRTAVTAIGAMVATLSGSRIVIRNNLAEVPCFVNVDPTQFDTAIVNFAVNARDAMDSEGTLTIAVDAVSGVPAVREKAAIEGAYIAVSITDTGTGIDPDHLAQIFEPFFTTKSVGKGTGLGLSQVFGFAHQSGGEVQVESVLGEGTTFTLYLPQAVASDTTIEPAQSLELVDGHGLWVLVVEDNDDVGKFATRALRELGYETTWASDAGEALGLLEKQPDRYDLVFSDVVMPGMSGVDLGLRIREIYHDLPVILTSGYSHVLAQNGTYGFDLLHKPYSIEQLSQTLLKSAAWHRRKEQMGE